MAPWRLRYISSALAERSSAAHCDSSCVAVAGVSRNDFTSRMRVAVSARSSSRPRRPKCHASPCVIVMCMSPTKVADARFTEA